MFHRVENFLEAVQRNVKDSLYEDIGNQDLSSTFLTDKKINAKVFVNDDDIVLCGNAWFENSFYFVDKSIKIIWHKNEGEVINNGDCVCSIEGKIKKLLLSERSALNFLQILSSTATNTRKFKKLLKNCKNSSCKVVDSRKTIPGLRLAQKYAVRVGGGCNQRFGLWDSVLLKENHLISFGGLKKLKSKYENILNFSESISTDIEKIQVEVENLEELNCAIDFGIKNILLDNFTIENLHKAVAINNQFAILEASGGIKLDNFEDYVNSGVDRVSIGALTKNINATDYSMRFQK